MIRILFFVCFIFLSVSCGSEDPELPVAQVMSAEFDEGDTNNSVSVSIILDKTFPQPVTVTVRSKDGTAEAGIDYVEIPSQELVFNSGEIEKTLSLNILGDDDFEQDETVIIEIIDVDNALLSGNFIEAAITLLNDDSGDINMVWNDEFDGTSLDLSNWTYEINGDGGGNNELQYYTDQNTLVLNGTLTIEAREESFGGRDYTSSRIITKDKYDFKYGRVEIRAKLPQGQGLWPALWMLGANWSTVGWPYCGEIDIMEMIGGQGRENTVHGTIHWQEDGSGHAFTGEGYTLSSGTFSDDFHVFAIEWDENFIEWYVDGELSHFRAITDAAKSELQEPHFFIFNVAVGGNWPGSPDGTTTFPQQMVVDYIRVFQEQ